MKKKRIKKIILKPERTVPMIRINTRVRPEQHVYIKNLAKKLKRTEGEIFRLMIDVAIEAENNY